MKNTTKSLSAYFFIAFSLFLATCLIYAFVNLLSGILVAPDMSVAIM